MIKVFFFVIFLIFNSTLFAQDWKTAVINDPDGFTNIRSGKGTNFEIIDKLYANELFQYTDSSEENWLLIRITKYNSRKPSQLYKEISGYVHRSRIREVNEMNASARKILFKDIFTTESAFFQQIKNMPDKESKEYREISGKHNVFHDYQFDLSLKPFTNYICDSKDKELITQFLDLLLQQSGSADESPDFALGRLFICDPDWTFEQIKSYKNLMGQLEWGIVNEIYDMPEVDAEKYRKKYNDLRVFNGMKKTDFSLYE